MIQYSKDNYTENVRFKMDRETPTVRFLGLAIARIYALLNMQVLIQS